MKLINLLILVVGLLFMGCSSKNSNINIKAKDPIIIKNKQSIEDYLENPQTYLNDMSIYYCSDENNYTVHSSGCNSYQTFLTLQDAKNYMTNWAIGAAQEEKKGSSIESAPIPCGIKVN